MKRSEANATPHSGPWRRAPWLKTFRQPIFGWVQLMAVFWMILQPLANLSAVYVPDSSGNPYWVPQYAGDTAPGGGPDWNTDTEGKPNWERDFEDAVFSGSIAWWGGSDNYVDGLWTSFPPQYHGSGIPDSDMDGLPDDLDPYPYDTSNHSFYWSGGTYRVNDVDYVFSPGYFSGDPVLQGDWDTDWDGIPNGADPYPGDSSNGNQPYFWWEGGTFQINNGASYFSAQYYFGSSSDSDGDGLPDAVDPYPYDSNNGNYINQTFDWSGGIYTISAGEVYFPPATYWGTWSDMDGDGIPDPADPYQGDASNNTAWWSGGVFRIDGQEVTAAGQWHRTDGGDGDTDGIPDDLDPYLSDPANNSIWWEGGAFWIDGVQTTFYPQFYKGPVADADGDLIPDIFDPYAANGSNGTSWWPGGMFLLDGSSSAYAGQYYAGPSTDSDNDGIPDALDPYVNDPWNNTYFSWNGGNYYIDGNETYFGPITFGGFWSDRDNDGIPDLSDPWPDDVNNNTAFWNGGTYLVRGVFTEFTGGMYRADGGDTDGDSIPNWFDPYPNDASNFSVEWVGGSFWVRDATMTFGSQWYAGVWSDPDQDGIPEVADPYPNDANNGNTITAFWWGGGPFLIGGEMVSFVPRFYPGFRVDRDGDSIPDGADPYPNDPTNYGTASTFFWAGGNYLIDRLPQHFAPGEYPGVWRDTDLDGIPDPADAYLNSALNGNSVVEVPLQWAGGSYYFDPMGEQSSYGDPAGAQTLPAQVVASLVDSDQDGIPNEVDPQPSLYNRKVGSYLQMVGLSLYVDGVYRDFYNEYWVTGSDSDGDGLYDEMDPYPHDATNNTGWLEDGTPYRVSDPDTDGDGLPDGADPSPNDPLNGLYYYWPAEDITFLVNSQPRTFHPAYFGGTLVDTDTDGIPDRSDLYPLDRYNNNDTDGDGIPDLVEVYYASHGLNWNDPRDGGLLRVDGLTNLQAYQNHLPLDVVFYWYSIDLDGDGMLNTYETANNLNPSDPRDAIDAPLGDFVFNFEKAAQQVPVAPQVTDPSQYQALTGHPPGGLIADGTKSVAENDWDGDGVSNVDEVRVFRTDPRARYSRPDNAALWAKMWAGGLSLTTRANVLWIGLEMSGSSPGSWSFGPPAWSSPAEIDGIDPVPPKVPDPDTGGGGPADPCRCPASISGGCLCAGPSDCDGSGSCAQTPCSCGCGQYGCGCGGVTCGCGCGLCSTLCACGLPAPDACECGCDKTCCTCSGEPGACEERIPDNRNYNLPVDDASGPRYRKIALNGRPLADEKPQHSAESDQEKEETYIDAMTLGLRHSVTDLFIPIPGSDLTVSVRRNAAPAIWNTKSGLRPHERRDRPFGAGWSATLAPTVEFVERPGEPLTAFVTDQNGSSHRFAYWAVQNYWAPWPTSNTENSDHWATFTGGLTGATYTTRYGSTITFVPSGKYYTMATDREQGSDDVEGHLFLRASVVTDRMGKAVQYTYSGATLTPDRISAGGNPAQTIEIRHNQYGLVTGIWEPNGRMTTYGYEESYVLPGNLIGRVLLLSQVRTADGGVTQYQYGKAVEWANLGDPVPKLHVDLAGITDPLGQTYGFTYQFDHSRQSFKDTPQYTGYYEQLGAPRNVTQVTLPGGTTAKFFNQSALRLGFDGTTGTVPSLTPESIRQTRVVDAEQKSRTYTWDLPVVKVATSLTDAYTDPKDVPKTVYFTRQTVDYGAGYGTEVYSFDLNAGLAVSSVKDLSGNLTHFEYADEWNAPTPYRTIFYGGVTGRYGDPTAQINAAGGRKEFHYTTQWRIMDRMKDEAGRVTENEVEPVKGRRTKETIKGPAGPNGAAGTLVQVTDFEYENASFPGVVTKKTVQFFGTGPAGARNLVTKYDLDLAGRVLTETVDFGAGGLNLVTRSTYDLNGNKLTSQDAKGQTTSFSYDERNRLQQVTYADGRTKKLTYDRRGNKKTEEDENGHLTEFDYDMQNRLITQRRPLAVGGPLTTRIEYNAVGSVTSTVDGNGFATTTEYDALQRPKKKTDAEQKVTWFDYGLNSGGSAFDSSGFKATWMQDANGTVTTTVNDELYRTQDVRTTAAGVVLSWTQMEYDAVGNVKLETDATGKWTMKDYDALNRPTKVTFMDGTTNLAAYTSTGWKWLTTDELGRTTETRYDGASRPVKVLAPMLAGGGQAVTETIYDAVGNVTATIDPLGRRTDHQYDVRNRKIRVEGPAVVDAVSGQTTRPTTDTAYDGVGNVLTVLDPRQKLTTMEYDWANRKLQTLAPAVPVPGEAAVVRPKTEMSYDGAGNVLSVIDPNGRVTTNSYDRMNRLKTTTTTTNTPGDGPMVVTNEYDAVGNRTAVVDGAHQRTEFTYDGLKRNLTVKNHLGQTTQFFYDGVNKYQRTDADGLVTNYGYDDRHRLTSVTYAAQPTATPPRSAATRSYSYDDAGRLLGVSEPSLGGKADVSSSYDTLNRVLTETSGGVTHTYTYDLAGNRLTTVYGDTNRTLVSTYDALNRLKTVTESGNRVTAYHYDLAGNVVKKVLPNGDSVATTYDGLGRSLVISGRANNGALLYQYAQERDRVGNVLKITEQTANLPARTVAMTYDGVNRLLSETETVAGVAKTASYTYDLANNRKTRTKTNGVGGSSTATYHYDQNNRLTDWSEGTKVITFDYNEAGSRIWRKENGVTNATYSYDPEQRLTSLIQDGTTYAYIYDYRTRRVERTEGGTTTKVIFSGGTSVQEKEGASTTVEYVRGSDWGGGVGGILYTLRSGTPSFTHYDSRGDVTTKTNGNGAVTYQAAYEAFGKRTAEQGSTADRQKANTKEEDPTGLLNEGMRYRDLETGTFTTADPAGFVDGPNLYAYVVQNPWTAFDPDGLSAWTKAFKIIRKGGDVAGAFAGASDHLRQAASATSFGPAFSHSWAALSEVLPVSVSDVQEGYNAITGAVDAGKAAAKGDFSKAGEIAKDKILQKVEQKAVQKLTGSKKGGKDTDAAIPAKPSGASAGAAKRGPKTDPTAPHNAKIKAEGDRLADEGNEILAGGGRAPEKAIPTPDGHKDSRRPDVLYRTPDGTTKGLNVGKTKADGSPVTREQKAIEDLNSAGVETDFVPYDR